MQVGLKIRLLDQRVITFVLPASAVVATGTREQIKKRVRVVVIPDPARSGDVVVELGLLRIKNFPLDLAQLHIHAQHVVPHLLKFNADFAVELSTATGSGEVGVSHARKSFAAGEACVGEKFPRGFRIKPRRGRCRIIRHAVRNKVRRGTLCTFGEFGDDAIFIRGESEGSAHSHIIERRLGDVEAIKISAEISEAVEVRSLAQHVHEFGGHEVFVPHDVGHACLVKIESGVGRASRQYINDLGRSIRRVPVTRIAQETHLVVHTPCAERERAARGQWFRVQPTVALFLDDLARHDGERREGTKLQEKCERRI